MFEFEEIRDEVEEKVRQAIRYYKLRHGLVDPSIYSRKDLGLKAVAEIYQQRDKGICEYEINKAIEKVSWSVKNQTSRKERLALEFLRKTASKGYYTYARLMKALGFPESYTIRPLTAYSINPLVELINPGGRVFVKSGEYPISATTGNAAIVIQGKDNVVLEGEGWKSTKLVTQGADTIAIKIGDRTDAAKACQDIVVRGFYIDGTSQTAEDTNPVVVDRRYGIEAASPNNETARILIEKNFIYNTGSDSIQFWTTSVVLVQNNIVTATRTGGASGTWAAIHHHTETGADPNRAYIVGNIIYNTANNVGGIRHGYYIAGNYLKDVGGVSVGLGRGAAITGARRSCIVGNVIIGSRTEMYGVYAWDEANSIIGNIFRIDTTGCAILVEGWRGFNYHTIKGNIIHENTGSGIAIALVGDKGCTVTGNIIKKWRYGIFLYGSQRNVIADNVLTGIGYHANNQYDVIRLQDYDTTHSTYNIIKGNQIYSEETNLPRYGIVEADTNQDYNIIANNIVTNCATAAILRQGTHSIEDNNIT